MELFDAEANESYTKQVKELIKAFIPTLELLSAKELPKDMRDEIGKKLSELMLPSLEYARCIEELRETGDMEQFARLSNEFIKKIAPEASSSMSSIGHVREVLFNTSKVEVAYIGEPALPGEGRQAQYQSKVYYRGDEGFPNHRLDELFYLESASLSGNTEETTVTTRHKHIIQQ